MQKITAPRASWGERPFSPKMRKGAEEGGYSLLDVHTLQERLRDGSLFLVDVRDAGVFAEGHIPGATCFPMPPTWLARFFKRWWLKKLLCRTSCKAVAFY